MTVINLIPMIVTPFIFLINIFLIKFGPSSYVPRDSKYLTSEGIASSLVEPRDQLMLLSWWLLTFFVIIILNLKYNKFREKYYSNLIVLIFSLIFLFLSIYSFIWDKDSTQTWRGVGIDGLIFGALITLYISYNIIFPNKYLITFNLILMSCFFIPALLQFPGSIRDYGHFKFTSDEMSLFAAGHLPLYDYYPQYTNLLGFPIALLQKVQFFEPTTVAVFWIVILQIILFIIIVKIGFNFGRKRLLVPFIFVAITPSISVADTPPNVNAMWLLSPSTYFAVFPIRLIIPVITIFILTQIINKNFFDFNIRNIILLGFFSGLTIINNLDYGIPFVLILSLYLFIVVFIKNRKIIIKLILYYLLSILFVPTIFYLVSMILQKPINLLNIFLFPRIFAFDGFGQYEIPNFGIHVSIISLFVTGTTIGWFYMKRSFENNSKYYFKYGSTLFIVSGWSLFCLVYFSGRSLIPTAVGGFAFLVSFITVLLLPLFRNIILQIKFYNKFNKSILLALVSLTTLIVGVSSTAIKIKSPSIYINKILAKPFFENTPLLEQVDAINNIYQDLKKDRGLNKKNIGFILELGNLTEIETGIDSLSTTNGPNYNMNVSNILIDMQCNKELYILKKIIITDEQIYNFFKSRQLCKNIFNLSDVEIINFNNMNYYLLKVKDASN